MAAQDGDIPDSSEGDLQDTLARSQAALRLDTGNLDDPRVTAAVATAQSQPWANDPVIPAAKAPQPAQNGAAPWLNDPEVAHESKGLATNFAGQDDIEAYQRAKARGASEEEALLVGDNGIGNDQLGGIKTPNVYGAAMPEDTLRQALGDDPAAWRRSRAQIYMNGQYRTVPIVDTGPGKGPQARGVTTDITAPLSNALGGSGMDPVTTRILKEAGPDYTQDPAGWWKEQHKLAASMPGGAPWANDPVVGEPQQQQPATPQNDTSENKKAIALMQQAKDAGVGQIPTPTPAKPDAANPLDVGKFLQTFVGSGVQQALTTEKGEAEAQLHPETRQVLPYEEQVQQAKEDAILKNPNTSTEEADDIIHQRNQRLAYVKANAQQNVEEATGGLAAAQSRVDQGYEATGPGQVAKTLGSAAASVVPGLMGPAAPLAMAVQMGAQTYDEEFQRGTDAAKKAHPEWTDDQVNAAATQAAETASRTSSESGVVLALLPVPKIGPLLARAVERIGMRGAYMAVAGAVQDISANKELQNIDPTQSLYDGVLAHMPGNFAAGAAFELPRAAGEAFGSRDRAPEPAQETPEPVTPRSAPPEETNAPINEPGAAQPETQPVTDETEKWVSAIANRYSQERSEQGEIGEIAPGEGYSKTDLRDVGLQMKPEEVTQHISDLMNDTGNPKLQAAAITAEEARLSQRSSQLSRVAEDNPNDPQARQNADNAYHDLTDFHNGPVAKLKNNWHAQGMTLQGEVPVDLSTFNGLREAWLRDVGTPITPTVESTMRDTAKRVRNAVTAEDMAMSRLGQEIEKRPSILSDDEVRNKIIARMKDMPCRT